MAYENPTFATSASPMPRMKVNVENRDNDHPFFTVDEWYSKEETNGIWKELDFLTDFKKFQLDEHGTLKINLDESYSNKNISNILSYRYKEKLELFHNQIDRSFVENTWKEFVNCKDIVTSVRYFHQSMGWDKHTSDDKFVSYTMFCDTHAVFEGGDLLVEDRKIKNYAGRLTFMPGKYAREITGIDFTDPRRTLGSGLYLITTTYN